jgi:uncharacterized membrane protein YfcA
MADLRILDLLLFAAGTLAAALATGVAGFAFGIVAAAAWLHFLPPAQTTALIVAYGLIVQGISVWKLRRKRGPLVQTFLRAGKAADGTIGILNGVIGGATGIAGIVVTIWCSLRRAARNLSAGWRLGLSDDRIVARRHWAGRC